MENRNGLAGADVRRIKGTAERDGALGLVIRYLSSGATLGTDKGYDVRAFVEATSGAVSVPIARHTTNGRRSVIDGCTARSKGYAVSQQSRERIEQAFGWVKTIGNLRKLPMLELAKAGAPSGAEPRRLQPDPDRRNRGMVESVADLRIRRKPLTATSNRSMLAITQGADR